MKFGARSRQFVRKTFEIRAVAALDNDDLTKEFDGGDDNVARAKTVVGVGPMYFVAAV